MDHWYFDEELALERMRDTQRAADRAWSLGPSHPIQPAARRRFQTQLGEWLVAVGKYLQRGEAKREPGLASSCQCGVR
jgi:hypothetical protein